MPKIGYRLEKGEVDAFVMSASYIAMWTARLLRKPKA